MKMEINRKKYSIQITRDHLQDVPFKEGSSTVELNARGFNIFVVIYYKAKAKCKKIEVDYISSYISPHITSKKYSFRNRGHYWIIKNDKLIRFSIKRIKFESMLGSTNTHDKFQILNLKATCAVLTTEERSRYAEEMMYKPQKNSSSTHDQYRNFSKYDTIIFSREDTNREFLESDTNNPPMKALNYESLTTESHLKVLWYPFTICIILILVLYAHNNVMMGSKNQKCKRCDRQPSKKIYESESNLYEIVD
ncbi:hypothetical protein RF11_07701 [Thelohanellus kitauei]|uniref:Uncharacterized protein n=1 Tax=Thelohanellus kitauei TaxID=669202 RepID=A0A0C2JDL6_THEKT|nr:hypothetical protein RF11_07701 [Thelohanellus kitauei]